jgi:hypothetical protein
MGLPGESTPTDRSEEAQSEAMAETLMFDKLLTVLILASLAIGIAFGPEIRHAVARMRSSDDSGRESARDEQVA